MCRKEYILEENEGLMFDQDGSQPWPYLQIT